MNVLWLPPELAQTLVHHAHSAHPDEACGLLAGKGPRVLQIIPTANIAADPTTRYVMSPTALARHLPQLEAEGFSLLGFYHSHPDGEAIPSETDIREATYPEVAMVIVGLRGEAPQIAAWAIKHGRVTSIPLHIGHDEPNILQDTSLSRIQQFAIVLAAVILVTLTVLISFDLLPPAPPIP